MDLVDDDRADPSEHLPAAGRGDEEVEGLGGRDDDVGRTADHRSACRRGGVAVAHGDAERAHDLADLLADRDDRLERLLEVLRDVDGERPQRRDVEDRRRRQGRTRVPVAQTAVDRDEESGEGLAGTGRRGEQGVLAPGDRRPTERLGRSRPGGEGAPEPLGDGGMERVEGRAGGHATAFYGGQGENERMFVTARPRCPGSAGSFDFRVIPLRRRAVGESPAAPGDPRPAGGRLRCGVAGAGPGGLDGSLDRSADVGWWNERRGRAHSGTLPCLRFGGSSRFVASISRLRARTRRVSAGSMTSST